MQRQLNDRIETYTFLINGQCKCGQAVVKVLDSSCASFKNGERFHYPNDLTANDIFRCQKCKQPIRETFKASELKLKMPVFTKVQEAFLIYWEWLHEMPYEMAPNAHPSWKGYSIKQFKKIRELKSQMTEEEKKELLEKMRIKL